MKFDFESLSAEPLFYMLMQSGVFVTVLGFIFFVIGLLFGYATWGRYKRLTRELRSEAASMKAEIADLKRKVGEHSVKAGPAIAMATETIYLPKKEGAPAAGPLPAVTEETRTTQTIPAPNRSQSSKAPAPAKDETMPSTPPAASAMFPDESSLSPLRDLAPLTEIMASQPDNDEHSVADEPSGTAAGLWSADALPALDDLSMTPLPAVEIPPVVDPKLGLIYLTQPKQMDDLTAIKGIAQVFEQRLQELGIYTYAQIAAWDEDQVKEFSSRLACQDRIQRDNWVKQAREMAEQALEVA